jgi:hypothetical protein
VIENISAFGIAIHPFNGLLAHFRPRRVPAKVRPDVGMASQPAKVPRLWECYGRIPHMEHFFASIGTDAYPKGVPNRQTQIGIPLHQTLDNPTHGGIMEI